MSNIFPEKPKTICSTCDKCIQKSVYHHRIFKNDEYAEWAANLVIHYHNDHIKYYDSSWKNTRYRNKNPEYKYTTRQEFKEIINNGAKRQMIKAIAKNMQPELAVSLISGFLKLQHNDQKTIELINKKLKVLKILLNKMVNAYLFSLTQYMNISYIQNARKGCVDL